MMNYLAKYSIAQCVFPIIKSNDTLKDVTFIGILELTPQGLVDTDFLQIDLDVHFKSAITIESRLGGGIGFPNREDAFEIMSTNHSNLINAFLDTISQKNIVLFDDGERYATVMMLLVMRLAKERGKYVTCASVGPPKFIGNKKVFNASWEEIGAEADKSILFNLQPIEIESQTMRDFYISRHKEIWKYVYELWKKINNNKIL